MTIYYCKQCRDEALVRHLASTGNTQMILSADDCKALYGLLIREYIPYDDSPGRAAVDKIFKFIEAKEKRDAKKHPDRPGT